MKDFEDHYRVGPNYESTDDLDPYNNPTNEVVNMIVQNQRNEYAKVANINLLASIVLAPFHTIVSSLQLSVAPHKNIYASPQTQKKELAKINKQLSVAEKRRLEISIRAGGKQPYVAPIYDGYKGVIMDLYEQGIRGFMKGTFFRFIYTTRLYSYIYGKTYFLPQIGIDKIKEERYLRDVYGTRVICWGVLTLFDYLLMPTYGSENRYVLENIRPDFKVFGNHFLSFYRYSTREHVRKGWHFHLVNNCIDVMFRLEILFECGRTGFNLFFISLYNIFETLAYPCLTAFKRVTAQSENVAGMLPTRYKSFWHCLKLMRLEEPKGLWKGFSLHLLATNLRLLMVAILMAAHKLQDEIQMEF